MRKEKGEYNGKQPDIKGLLKTLKPNSNYEQNTEYIIGDETVTVLVTTTFEPHIKSGLASETRKVIFFPETIVAYDNYMEKLLREVNQEKHDRNEYYTAMSVTRKIEKIRNIFINLNLLPPID